MVLLEWFTDDEKQMSPQVRSKDGKQKNFD